MAGDPFRLLTPGEPLDSGVGPFNLTWHNEMTEAWRHFKRSVPSVSAEPAEVPTQDDFLIANISGGDIPRYGIVGLVDDDFCVLNENQVAIYSAAPSPGAPFAVTLDPIPAAPCFVGLVASSNVDPPSGGTWGKVLGSPRPSLWSSAANYVAGNLVYTGDLLVYWATAPSLNQSPPNAAYWQLVGTAVNRRMYQRGVSYHIGDIVFLPTVGRARLDGAARCTVDVVDRSHSFAAPIDGDYAKLMSQNKRGPAQILVRRGSTGNLPAVVMICCCAETLTEVQLHHATDCFIGPPEPSHATDAYLVWRLSLLHATDAYLVDRGEPSHTTDCFLLLASLPNHTTDAFLLKVGDQWHRTDCFLKPSGHWHATDAYVVARSRLSHRTDCLVKPSGLWQTADLYSIVRGAPAHRTDCLVAPSGLWYATDGFLVARLAPYHRTDCFLKPAAGHWHATDCFVIRLARPQHTTDCFLFDPLSPRHSTDCFLKPGGHWHAADTRLLARLTPNHATNCFIAPVTLPWHATDSFLKNGHLRPLHSTDCFIKPAGHWHATDAYVVGGSTPNHTTDCFLARPGDTCDTAIPLTIGVPHSGVAAAGPGTVVWFKASATSTDTYTVTVTVSSAGVGGFECFHGPCDSLNFDGGQPALEDPPGPTLSLTGPTVLAGDQIVVVLAVNNDQPMAYTVTVTQP